MVAVGARIFCAGWGQSMLNIQLKSVASGPLYGGSGS